MAEVARQRTREGVAPREHSARTENAGTYSSFSDTQQPVVKLRPIDRAEGPGGGQLQPPGWKAADSFGDNNLVTFGIRNHALVVSVARPSWPIEKREPVVLQSFCTGVDGGPRAQLYTQVCVPDELARAL